MYLFTLSHRLRWVIFYPLNPFIWLQADEHDHNGDNATTDTDPASELNHDHDSNTNLNLNHNLNEDMGGPSAQIEVSDSVKAMLKLIQNLKPEDSGQFLNREGKPLPY